MSLPPRKEKDAQVEGRDPKAKETMGAFKALMKRLLKVPMSEVREQQALFESRQKPMGAPHAMARKGGPRGSSSISKHRQKNPKERPEQEGQ